MSDYYSDLYFLPDSLVERIEQIISSYHPYFSKDVDSYIEEIMKIQDDGTKFDALLELKNNAKCKLQDYRVEYSRCLNSLIECHLSSRFFDRQSYVEGAIKAGDKVSVKNYLPYSIENNEFAETEYLFQSKLDAIEERIRSEGIKIEVLKKYNIKNLTHKETSSKKGIDIYKEFSKLFANETICKDFIGLLKTREYITDSESWIGLSGNPGELRDAYTALKQLGLLRSGNNHAEAKRIFYKRFGLAPEEPGVSKYYISRRSLSSENCTKDFDIFKEILTDQFLKKK